MVVIVNGRFLIRQITGVERYAREILAQLDELVEPGRMELALPPEANEMPSYRNIRVVRTGRLRNRLWEHISFPLYVRSRRGISLNLCNVAPLLSPGIVCIHDVKIKAVPQYFSGKFLLWYRLLFANAARRAKQLLTVSEFSKREICKYYRVDADRISVIPNAWQHYSRIDYDEHALEKYGLEKGEYFFSMCSLEPNKNFRWIAEAARRNPDRIFAVSGARYEAVFADGAGFSYPENMKLMGYVSDGEAKALMRDCRAFLFPTFYEGFGIPPLEAICAGAQRVVVSDTEVMREVYGNSVIYVDPNRYDVDLEKLEPGENAGAVLEEYSWQASAAALLRCLENICHYAGSFGCTKGHGG